MNNIKLITDNDLCVSCGACKHACPYQEIQIRLNETKEIYEPVIANISTCLTCDNQLCLQVCPSYEEDFISMANWTDASQRIGPVEAIYTGHSTSRDIHIRSSSGGIIRELCRHYLESGFVDGVITLKHIAGLDYEPHLYTSINELIENMPGSIYHNVNFENAIEILKNTTGKFALIAGPCQLTSVRKWQHACSNQNVGKIEVAIGFICGWMYSRHTVKHFARYKGIKYENLTDVSYRGGDNIGNFILKDSSGQEHKYYRRPEAFKHDHVAPFKVAFSRTYVCKRCLFCVEHLNFLADIVVGDAWLDRFQNDKMGTSIVIVRNNSAIAVFDQLSAKGRILLETASEDDVVASQSEYFAFSTPARQIVNKLRTQGKFSPVFRLPYPENSHPKFAVWYKNYLNPALFRFFTWRGLGYPWFLCRIAFFWLITLKILTVMTIKRPIKFILKYSRVK